VVTPVPGTDPAAVERVAGFWRGLGARVALRDPAQHDVDVAWVSHLPHVLAFAFAHAFGQAPPSARETVGSGFRDFTRIARSDGALWSEILNGNRKALAGPLEDFGQSLRTLAHAIDNEDLEAQEQFFALAHRALSKVSNGTEGQGEG
jgi:prephenate dehydrogenase